ncbi:hypothetical protein MHF_0657 [Mycoplasma haemofelis Ohio2]|uniref:Uncharacterized protein n=1 Tax=Mycoplasma haemofelis (strain Ohio2) TaxID=859194 RepID=F6FI81_MYCHI|nr:hypothetical protein MHF_0657 [Mycoplasma haemofelis Ohio2]
MKFAGVKFLAGGATAASATGLGALGVSSMDWKEKPKELTKTKSEDSPVAPEEENTELPNTPTESTSQTQSTPTCTVFKIENKGGNNQKITEIKWEEEKGKDANATTTNKTFWDDVDKACKGGYSDKPSYNGKVYVTETNGTWVYSRDNQKEWPSPAK